MNAKWYTEYRFIFIFMSKMMEKSGKKKLKTSMNTKMFDILTIHDIG